MRCKISCMRLISFSFCLAFAVAALGAEDPSTAIQPSWIAPHVRFLSDSTLEGRDTGTPGYQIAANYVAAQFELLGLTPAGDNGTYFQRVPLRKSRVVPGSVSLTVDGKALQFERDFFVHASGNENGIDANGPLVFVGYGVSAPKQGYDDYKGIDAHGKIVVFLAGTPASLPIDIRGWYSRPVLRIAAAREHGAAGAIMLVPPSDAATLQEHFIRQLDATSWVDENGHAHNSYIEDSLALIPKEGVASILDEQHTLSEIQEHLKSGPFSFDLHRTATLRAQFEHADETSANVIALLRGRDLPNEYVVYTAHLDHDGTSAFFKGDPVLHGALDNAGGVATILADARAFTRGERPRRSILFIAVTAEEKGVVGSDYFVHHPTVPHDAIVADINCDNFLWYFPVRDVSGVGREYSTLNRDFVSAAKDAGIEASEPIKIQQPLLVLSDHFSFLNGGIPAISIFNGNASGDGKRSGAEIWTDYFRNVHHTPNDSIDQAIDWNAAVTETRFAFRLGARIANDAERPRFNGRAFFAHAP